MYSLIQWSSIVLFNGVATQFNEVKSNSVELKNNSMELQNNSMVRKWIQPNPRNSMKLDVKFSSESKQ